MREIVEGMLDFQGKMQQIGLNNPPARSTISDANRKRSYLVFEELFYSLLRHYQSCISDSRLKGLSIRTLKIIDSTTIQLFGDILQGVGRNTLDGSRKKGGAKVHMMMDAFSGVAEFVKITAAKVHDRRFLYELSLPKNSFIVFDKAYNIYNQFAKWNKENIYFVTRIKDNAIYRVNKILINRTIQKKRCWCS